MCGILYVDLYLVKMFYVKCRLSDEQHRYFLSTCIQIKFEGDLLMLIITRYTKKINLIGLITMLLPACTTGKVITRYSIVM